MSAKASAQIPTYTSWPSVPLHRSPYSCGSSSPTPTAPRSASTVPSRCTPGGKRGGGGGGAGMVESRAAALEQVNGASVRLKSGAQHDGGHHACIRSTLPSAAHQLCGV